MERWDENTVKAARKGDRAAFQTLYQNVYQDLYRYAFLVLKNKQDAEDAVSETVVDAYSGIGRLKNTCSFSVWMFRILSCKVKRRLKYYALREEEPLDEVAPLLSDREDCSSRTELMTVISSLEDADRQIVLLSVIGCYTSREIAEILSMNPSTVRSKLSRALQKLNGMLSEN